MTAEATKNIVIGALITTIFGVIGTMFVSYLDQKKENEKSFYLMKQDIFILQNEVKNLKSEMDYHK